MLTTLRAWKPGAHSPSDGIKPTTTTQCVTIMRNVIKRRAANARWRKSPKGKLAIKSYAARYRAQEHVKDQAYWAFIKRTYGLSKSEWYSIFEQQQFTCAACKSSCSGLASGRWATDHQHGVVGVRGILCMRCNTALGYLEDKAMLPLWQLYLERHR